MSRDVFYIVPSESDGRNNQHEATREPVNSRHGDDTDADNVNADDQNEQTDNSVEEDIRPYIKDKVYYAAKDGLPIALTSLLSSVENEATRNAYINQVNLIHFWWNGVWTLLCNVHSLLLFLRKMSLSPPCATHSFPTFRQVQSSCAIIQYRKVQRPSPKLNAPTVCSLCIMAGWCLSSFNQN